ncbi:hypothetical protein NDU88_004867 [Pleurodeles waltl]|uniref:Uncharacterized protein n=1 Tax=Pleurodeles waltl TaxID=8319 RepID=A0AAV7M7J9_PLEWA|nr:hypothetical protein NDU88_004867 [Pleurodeles waltl]
MPTPREAHNEGARQPEKSTDLAMLQEEHGSARCNSEGQKLAARSGRRGPGRAGGAELCHLKTAVGARSGCEAAWRAAGIVAARVCLFNSISGPPAPGKEIH